MFACMRTRVMGNAEIGQKGAEKMTAEDVKKSLIRQLEDRGANVEHFLALIDDYVFYYKLTYRPEVSEVAPIITSAFISHKIRWGDSMTMRWYTNNACRKIDSNGNITFEKIEPKTRKTDGFMAFVAAFIVATKHEDIFEVLPDVDKLPGVFVF